MNADKRGSVGRLRLSPWR